MQFSRVRMKQPCDPMLSTEPTDATLRTDAVDPTLRMDAVDPRHSSDAAQATPSVVTTLSPERAERADVTLWKLPTDASSRRAGELDVDSPGWRVDTPSSVAACFVPLWTCGFDVFMGNEDRDGIGMRARVRHEELLLLLLLLQLQLQLQLPPDSPAPVGNQRASLLLVTRLDTFDQRRKHTHQSLDQNHTHDRSSFCIPQTLRF